MRCVDKKETTGIKDGVNLLEQQTKTGRDFVILTARRPQILLKRDDRYPTPPPRYVRACPCNKLAASPRSARVRRPPGKARLLGDLASNRVEVTLPLRRDAAALRVRHLLHNLQLLELRGREGGGDTPAVRGAKGGVQRRARRRRSGPAERSPRARRIFQKRWISTVAASGGGRRRTTRQERPPRGNGGRAHEPEGGAGRDAHGGARGPPRRGAQPARCRRAMASSAPP